MKIVIVGPATGYIPWSLASGFLRKGAIHFTSGLKESLRLYLGVLQCIICCIFLVSYGVSAENYWEETDSSHKISDIPAPSVTDSDISSVSPITSEQDAAYTIKKGDTLWDLAFQFLGNPFDWQKIWQVNSYITNPDLIYPGNSLQIPGKSTSVIPESDPGNLIPSETFGAINPSTTFTTPGTSDFYPGDIQFLTLLRKRQVLSAQQLLLAPFLWTEKDQKGMIAPGNGVVKPPERGTSYQLFSTIQISLFKNTSYQVGDTINLFKSLRMIMFNNKPVNLVQCCGRAVIKKITDRKGEALLFEMSDVISGNERISRKKKDISLQIDTLISADAAISAEVFTRVEQTASPYPFQKIILNKGSLHGVQIGDVFIVYNKKTAHLSVIGIIVHTTGESSTLNMAYMRENHVDDGDEARLVRRSKFTE